MAVVITGSVAGKSGVVLLARIVGQNGVPITPATIISVTYTLTDLVTLAQVVGSFVVASVLSNSLQIDPRWTIDSAARPGADKQWGYNFAATLPASIMTSANRQRCDVVFTPVAGEPFRVPFEWLPKQVYG